MPFLTGSLLQLVVSLITVLQCRGFYALSNGQSVAT